MVKVNLSPCVCDRADGDDGFPKGRNHWVSSGPEVWWGHGHLPPAGEENSRGQHTKTHNLFITSCIIRVFCKCVFLCVQFEGSESQSNSNLGQRQRPTSELNTSSSQSPTHLKVTRSISANQKQRRYSDHGGDDDDVIEKPSKVPVVPPGSESA